MPPTKATLAVDHDDLAVHAAQHVDAQAQQARAGIEHVDAHAGVEQRSR